jgi:hypothetical protein
VLLIREIFEIFNALKHPGLHDLNNEISGRQIRLGHSSKTNVDLKNGKKFGQITSHIVLAADGTCLLETWGDRQTFGDKEMKKLEKN